jgi:hypothetical protein
MRINCLLVTWFTVAIGCIAFSFSAPAQTRPAKPKPEIVAAPAEKCLRALDGSCTNPAMVEAARVRGAIIPAVRVAYEGTPLGTIGGPFIPFERFFQDNPVVFGLPTSTFFCCNTFRRSK